MVSIEEKCSYTISIKENRKLSAFHNLLNLQKIGVSKADVINQADRIYFQLLEAISGNNKKMFNDAYNTISLRKPDQASTSPFIYDDFLIFALLLGVRIFDANNEWISKIIELRSKTNITHTFSNILKKNYLSNNNNKGIVITFLDITKEFSLPEQFYNDFYNSISLNPLLFQRNSDFETMATLRAYDIFLLNKQIPPEGEYFQLRIFEKRFISRCKIIAIVIYNIILLGAVLLLISIFSLFPTLKETLNDVRLIIGLLGVSLLGNISSAARIKTEKIVQQILGYNRSKAIK